MKITFFLPSYPYAPSGGFKVIYTYANELVKRGHTVFVIHPRILQNHYVKPKNKILWIKEKVARFRDIFITPKIEWCSIDPRITMLFIPKASSKYFPDADVIIATAWATAEIVENLPSIKGAKYYLIQSYEIWSGPKERVDRTWQAPLSKIVIAKWLYQKGLELGVDAHEMIHIPNAIDLHKYLLQIPIEDRGQKVCMLYHSMSIKGAADGIKALTITKIRHPGLEAILFGVEPRPENLPLWITYYQNPSQELLVQLIYNGSSIYLCPSHLEGWGLPPTEAMACGCALVSTNIGGVLDYAEDQVTALLSTPQDPLALANNLDYLLHNTLFRTQLARNGYNKIQTFSWTKSGNMLEQFLQKNSVKSKITQDTVS